MRYKKKQESVRVYDQIVKTVCQECLVGCGLKFFKHHNKVVDIAGDEDHPINKGSVCPRGAKIVQNLYHHDDMLARYPVAKKAFDNTEQRISWDDGIDYVAGQLAEIGKEYGKDALAVLISNPNSFTNHYLGLRFAKVFGTNHAAVYDPMKPASDLAKLVLGGVKGALCNPPHDWINSKVILVLGSEISSEVMLMGYLLDAKERGAKIICVDTKYSPAMAKANYPMIIKPGTFATFMLGIIHAIVSEELYDTKMMKRWVNGLSEIVRDCLSYKQTDIAAKCGLEPETISTLARLLAEEHPVQVLGALRDDQVKDNDDLVRLAWMSLVLLALSNSLGVKGGGWNWLGTGNLPFAFGKDMEDVLAKEAQDYKDLVKEITEKETCKALIWDGHIPAGSLSKEFIHALSKLKLVVHLSDQNDAARKYAHVSFPTTNWLEEEGPVLCSHYRAIQWNHKVIDALEERKPAGVFWLKLADKMGYQKWFPWDAKEPNFVEIANFHIKETGALACPADLKGEDLNPGGILWPCVTGKDAVFEDRALMKGRWVLYKYDDEYPGTNQFFPTASGKAELMGDACRNLGLGKNPFGSIEQETWAKSPYDYALVACSAISFLGNTGILLKDKYVAGIHPDDARGLNIKDGDKIVLEKENGATFEAPAWVTNRMMKNTVGIVDTEEPSYYARSSHRGTWLEGTPVRLCKK